MIDLELERPHVVSESHPYLGGMVVRPTEKIGDIYYVEWAEGFAAMPAEMLAPLPKFRGDTVVRLVELVRDDTKEGADA